MRKAAVSLLDLSLPNVDAALFDRPTGARFAGTGASTLVRVFDPAGLPLPDAVPETPEPVNQRAIWPRRPQREIDDDGVEASFHCSRRPDGGIDSALRFSRDAPQVLVLRKLDAPSSEAPNREQRQISVASAALPAQ